MEQMNPPRVLFTVTCEAQPERSQCLLKEVGGHPKALLSPDRGT